ncbi:MAG: DUF892 family protein [Alphaproteobacteria bacterium]|nr:DUF892 family protein [Alphaproteobacteria bacterium]
MLVANEIYSAERQISRALPRLAKRVSSDSLREMLDERREHGTSLIERIDEAFEKMQVSKGRQKECRRRGIDRGHRPARGGGEGRPHA